MGNSLPHDADTRAGVVQRLRGARAWRVGDKSPLLLGGTIILAVLLYLGRRPDQLIAPMVWAEETVILGRWYGGQYSAIIDPVAGQLVVVSSMLVSLAGALSFAYLPELEMVLIVAVFVATLLLLLLPDSRWGSRKVRCLMALSLALIPINPEPYLVLLFAFWWTSLWPIIVLGWRRDLLWMRLPVLIFAGISSLAAAFVAPVFLALFLWRRQRRDLWSALVLMPCLAVQIGVVLASERQYPALEWRTVLVQVARTFCLYVRGSAQSNLPQFGESLTLACGFGFVALLVVAVVRLRRAEQRAVGFALLLTLVGYAVLSSIPAPIISHPSFDGPRYYFLPFALLGMLLLFLVFAARDRLVRIGATVALLVALLPLVHDYARHADSVSWRDARSECALSESATYAMPVHADGRREALWVLVVATERCR